MFGLDLTHLAAYALLAVGAIGFLYQNRGIFSYIKLPSFGGTPAPVDDDALDFQALTRLQKRFVRLNCPEGKAAIQVLLAHFYHEA